MAGLLLAAVTAVAAALGCPSGAWAQSPYAGIYLGTFSGPNDDGRFAILVRNSGSAIVAGFDRIDVLGFVKENIAVNAGGSFFDTNIDGLGTSVGGTFSMGSVSGTFVASDSTVGTFSATEESTVGFLRSAAGHYTGTMSGNVTVSGVPQFSTSGTIDAILAADGSAFGFGSASGGGFSADDGGFINVSPGGAVSGVFLDGTTINGSADTVNRTASGTYSVTVFVSGVTAVHSGTWSMSRKTALPNSAPVAVNDSYSTTAAQSLVVNGAAGVLANDSDPDGDPLSANLASGPSNGTVSLGANGGFTYTPNASFVGNDSFTYRASDGLANSNLATATINVTNQTPVANNDTYSVLANRTLVVDAGSGVLANDSDADGDPLSANLAGGPSHGILSLSGDGAFSYTPERRFSGIDSFTYRASDGTADSNLATGTITVDAILAMPWLMLLRDD